MKILMNLLLWTTQMEEDMLPVLENLKQIGFDGVEVPVMDTSTTKWQTWAHRLKDIGLTCTAVTVCGEDDNIIHPDAGVRRKAVQKLKGIAECSQLLGASILSGPIHSALNVFSGKPASQEEWHWAVSGIREVSGHAATCGITLGIEYLNRFENYLLSSIDETIRFVQEVNHPNCKIMFDTFHANIEEKDIEQAFRKCASETVHIQISENDRSTPGKGHINWTAFFNAVQESGYKGDLSIEAFGRRQPELAAATKIWRKMFESENQLAADGLAFLKHELSKRRDKILI